MPSLYITQSNIILRSYIYSSLKPSKSILLPIPNPIFISPNSYHYSIVLPPFSTISLHFYPSTSSIVENVENFVENLPKILNHIQTLFNYCLNIQEIPRKPSIDILCTQIIIRLDDLTHIFSLNTSTSIYSSIYSKGSYIFGEPSFPTPPPLPEKTFSLFSSSPHFVRVAVKPFFIYRTCGSQMKKPTSSCGYFEKSFREKSERCICKCFVNYK